MNFWRKVISFIASFSLLLNSLSAPAIALAQEVTPTPDTTTVISTEPSITPEATATPIDTTTPSSTPTDIPASIPSIEASPEATIAPTLVPTEAPIVEQTDNTVTPVAETINPEPSVTPLVTATPIPTTVDEKGILSTQLTETSVFPNSLEQNSWFKVVTDKLDYAPTESAIITGTSFIPNQTYSLTVSSTDDPATSTSVEVITSSDGSFTYTYQLDGKYRPNYSIEMMNQLGEIVATASFTDAYVPSYSCVNDSAGSNDEPGQKDLTRLCRDLGNPDPLYITWNWDVVSMSGSNTADACSLFDTNNNGFANYSLCVTWDKAQHQVTGSPTLYSCNDSRTDRCSGATQVLTSISSSCSVGNTTDDPFVGDDSYNNDTKATCTIPLSDVGGVSHASLLDVCSYPSVQPNSDPSDCVIIQPTKGNLTIIKNVVPDAPTTNWNFAVSGGSSLNLSIAGDGTTGVNSVNLATYSITETAGANTSLANYSTSWSCSKNGAAYLSGTGTTASSIVIGKSGNTTDSVVCTFTNTYQSGTVIVHKDVQGPSGESLTDTSHNFSVSLDGGNTQSITDNATVTYNNVSAGSHTISETSILTGYSLYSITPDSNSSTSGAQITVTAGQTTDVYVVNRQQNATVTIHKNVINPDGGEVSDNHTFTVQKDGGSDKTMAEGTDAIYTVTPGTYTFTEVSDSNYTLYSITGDNDANASNGATITVLPGGNSQLTFVNKQKKATITVEKNVVAPDGTTDISDNHSFSVTLNSEIKSFSENSSTTFSVNPGTFGAVESSDQNYVQVSNDGPVTVSSNGSATIHIVNKQKNGTITIHKNVIDPDGGEVSDLQTFTVKENGVNSKTIAENIDAVYSVAPGTYTYVEDSNSNYTLDSITGDNDSDKTNGASITISSNGSAELTFVNKQKKATITVEKNVVAPDGTTDVSDSHTFSVTLNGTTKSFGEGSSATFSVNPGIFGATETTDSDYTLVSNDGPVTVSSNGTATIHIVNKQKSATITVIKDVKNPNGEDVNDNHTFTAQVNGANDKSISENSPATYTLNPGIYSISELDDTNYTEMGCKLPTGTVALDFSILSNQSITVTCVNYQMNANITIHKNVINPDGGEVSDAHSFEVKMDGSDAKQIAEGTDAVYSIIPGTYTFTETSDGNYTLDSITGDNDSDKTNGVTITVKSNESKEATFINKQKKATITIVKDVRLASGGDVNDNHTFSVTLDGVTKDFSENSSASFSVNPGTYGVTESATDNYTYVSDDGPKTVGSNGEATITVINEQNVASISGYKYMADGVTPIEGWGIQLLNCVLDYDNCASSNSTTTDANGYYSFGSLDTGLYQVSEDLVSEYTPVSATSHNISLTPGENSTNQNFSNFKNINITACKVEDGNGVIEEFDQDQTSVSGWLMTLYKNGEQFAQQETGEDGCTTFENLGPAESYEVYEGSREGWYAITDTYHNFGTPQDGQDDSYTFVNAKLATLGDTIYQDDNSNASQDSGETGIMGISVNLYKDDGDGIFEPGTDDPFIGTESTNTLGEYLFEDITAGSYWVKINETTLPFGYALTTGNDPMLANILPGENYVDADFGYVPPIKDIQISKTNDKSGAVSKGDGIVYTLTLTNNGNVTLYDVTVTDNLPGGFTYVSGSTAGDISIDPTITGNKLTWNIGTIKPGADNSIRIQYKVVTNSDLTNGDYINIATCTSSFGNFNEDRFRKLESVNCEPATSTVTIEDNSSYGGNLHGQVLGISTELPATGSPTWIILFALGLIGTGVILKKKYVKN